MRAPANRAEMTVFLAEQNQVTPEAARQMLGGYYEPDRGAMPKQAEIDVEGVRTVIALLRESGELKGATPQVESLLDLSYLQAAGLQ
jgi:hypothetical protein